MPANVIEALKDLGPIVPVFCLCVIAMVTFVTLLWDKGSGGNQRMRLLTLLSELEATRLENQRLRQSVMKASAQARSGARQQKESAGRGPSTRMTPRLETPAPLVMPTKAPASHPVIIVPPGMVLNRRATETLLPSTRRQPVVVAERATAAPERERKTERHAALESEARNLRATIARMEANEHTRDDELARLREDLGVLSKVMMRAQTTLSEQLGPESCAHATIHDIERRPVSGQSTRQDQDRELKPSAIPMQRLAS